MEALKFKTNIKCTGCLATVTPVLNKELGEGNWEVDLQDPQRTLTVPADASETAVIASIKNVGFEAEKL